MSTATFANKSAEPKPLFPALGRYYGFTADLAYLIVRVTAGLMLLPHGWSKLVGPGVAGVSAMISRYGIPEAHPLAFLIMWLETFGGVLIAIGLFTRPVAALLLAEFLVIIVAAHWSRGYFAGAGGIEFPLMWALLLLAVLLRGGGPWSIDRKLGREV